MSVAESCASSTEFTFHPSVSQFNVPIQTFLSKRKAEQQYPQYGYIAAGALLFDNSPEPRILLIQRAAEDSMPNLWEVPGGGCDDEDPTILHSVARELWEEAGLDAATIGPRVGNDHIFLTRSGKAVCKFNFLVIAKTDSPDCSSPMSVKLDHLEHQNFVWATEQEVRAQRVNDVQLNFTTKEQKAVILEAFDAVKAIRAENSQPT